MKFSRWAGIARSAGLRLYPAELWACSAGVPPPPPRESERPTIRGGGCGEERRGRTFKSFLTRAASVIRDEILNKCARKGNSFSSARVRRFDGGDGL